MSVGRNSRRAGLSLVELMVIVAIIAIIAMIAAPSFSGWLERYRVRGAAEGIQSFLQYARSECVKECRELAVQVTPGDSGGWCLGLSNVHNDGDTLRPCNCNDPSATGTEPEDNVCAFGPTHDQVHLLRGVDFPGVSLTATDTWIAVDQLRGGLDEGTITLTGANGNSATISHAPTGLLRVCGTVGGMPEC